MKFLCVTCDEPMRLASVDEAGGGSLTVVYGCPTCSHQIAMLTNALETEMVQSLGVKIGPAVSGEAATAAGGRCPFSGMVREMEETAAAAPAGPVWTDSALARLAGIPDFVRPMAKQGIEHYARTEGYGEIDERVLEEARGRFGM